MIDFQLLQAHIFAVIRDSGNSVMPICSRIELCLMNECVAVYEGRYMDTHYWVRGNSFYVFRGHCAISVGGVKINFRLQKPLPDQIDRFDISSYDFCVLAKLLHHQSDYYGVWNCVSIDKELAHWLDQPGPLDVQTLSFISSNQGHTKFIEKHDTTTGSRF